MGSPNLSTFLLIALADCVASTSLYIPFTFLPDEASSKGVSLDDASFLIAAMGISSSMGRICSGWLCDRSWCNPAVLTTSVVALACIPLLLFSTITNYALYLVLSCLFGFLTGIWIAATSPLLVRVLGLPLLSPAAGAAVDILGDRGL